MSLPYRTRQGLKRFFLVLLAILVLAVAVWLCWLLWLSRYIIYTRDGAKLDFSLDAQVAVGEPALPPGEQETVSIYYNEGENVVETTTELKQLLGYYVELSQLREDPAAVIDQLRTLPAGTPVLVDVKNIYGSAYFSSSVVEPRSDQVEIAAMDELIQYLSRSGLYTIARLPALCDKNYGRNHVPSGIYHKSRGYLWMDSNGCYWLNPTKDDTVSYLMQQINELKNLGFDEVVLSHFYVTDNQNIYFPDDKAQALAKAAQTLVTSCTTDTFAVSFVVDTVFAPPEGRNRLYLMNAEAAQAAALADSLTLDDPAIRAVFLTEFHDTRFEAYGVLRPLSTAE